MTILVFTAGRFSVATETWTATEYHSHATVPVKPLIEIHVNQKIVDRVQIDLSMEEFLELIAEGGKVVDLRKLQR